MLGAAVGAVADPEAAGLVVGRVRRRGQLPIALLRREPRFEVVALGRRGAQVRRRNVDDTVGEPELLREGLLGREQPVVLVPGFLRANVREHLHLVELVDAEHPARIAPGRARLPAEVRGEGRIAERELVRFKDLAHVQAG